MDVPNLELNEWLEGISQYQRSQLLPALEIADEKHALIAANLWLAAAGSEVTRPFGGEGQTKSLAEAFMVELRELLCGTSAKYAEERKKLLADLTPTAEKGSKGIATTLVSTIAAILAIKLGVFAGILVAPVALLLFTIGKMGRNAWCNTQQSTVTSQQPK